MGRITQIAAVILIGTAGASIGYYAARQPEIQSQPFQDFERRFESYSAAQTAVIETHVQRALSGLSDDASEFDKAAAMNAYIYATVERKAFAGTGSGAQVLADRAGVCGGMVVSLAEMLHSVGIKSRLAYTIGGKAAHSMLEVYFSDGAQGLFDPYHGIAYYDAETKRPVSILSISEYISQGKAPVSYVQRAATPMRSFAETYAATDEAGRTDYAYPDIFTHAEQRGIANSGFVNTIHIELRPGDLIGIRDWAASPDTPYPWTHLSLWQSKPGYYLSWAYVFGQTGLGYMIEHAYTMADLTPGQEYALRLHVSNAYPRSGSLVSYPAITLQPVAPFGEASHHRLRTGGYGGGAFEPQVAEYRFTAVTTQAVVVANPIGNFVLHGIDLVATSAQSAPPPLK